MVHARYALWIVQEFGKRARSRFLAPEFSGVCGGVQLLQKPFQVSEPLRPSGVLERLVLGEDVDETLADVVAVLEEQLAAAAAQRFHHLAALPLGGARVGGGLRPPGGG